MRCKIDGWLENSNCMRLCDCHLDPRNTAWPEVTKEQVAAIDKIVAPEFSTGDWRTVEKE